MGLTNTIADLRQQIHDDLRTQHPEWVLPNGESPMCDAYEARLMDELSELGVREEDIDRFVDQVEGSLDNDPGEISRDNLRRIYRASL